MITDTCKAYSWNASVCLCLCLNHWHFLKLPTYSIYLHFDIHESLLSRPFWCHVLLMTNFEVTWFSQLTNHTVYFLFENSSICVLLNHKFLKKNIHGNIPETQFLNPCQQQCQIWPTSRRPWNTHLICIM